MAENFDLIFGQSSGSQYAWSESDYQNGWETVGNTPPTAQQFDALQRRSDLKAQELNNALTPLVNASQTDNRQPSTAYSEGDIKYSPLIPTGWFLACTVSGTSSASELVVPSPVAEGDEITDGGVTWKVKKIGGAGDAGDGVPLGAILQLAHNSTLPAGYLLCDGSAVSRTMFPDLFNAIGTTYGAGDGSTTFNVPDYNTAKRFVQGDTVAGTVKAAGLPNITGEVTNQSNRGFIHTSGYTTGAFKKGTGMGNTVVGSSPEQNYAIAFDASLSNPIYGASTTVQPNALTARYIIKAFDGQTPDSALIDITQYANELANKATRALDNLTQDGEDHFLGDDNCTIIYPNGGSESSPANVTTNTRYVESNPFPGYYVKCIAEIQYNNDWAELATSARFTSVNYGLGYHACQYNDSEIVLQIGSGDLFYSYDVDMNPFHATSHLTTAPCRIKVYKIGKIPT